MLLGIVGFYTLAEGLYAIRKKDSDAGTRAFIGLCVFAILTAIL